MIVCFLYFASKTADLSGDLMADDYIVNKLVERNAPLLKKLISRFKGTIKKSTTVDGESIKYLKKLVSRFEKALDNAQGGVKISQIGGADEEREETADSSQQIADSETNIRFSKNKEEYPYSMQTVIKEYIDSVDEKILKAAENLRENKNDSFVRQKICDVDSDFIAEVKDIFDLNVDKFTVNINSNAFNHIEKRHGLNGEADKSMANLKDLARIGYVIQNRDSLEPLYLNGEQVYSKEFSTKEGTPAPLMLLKKKINGTYYCAIAVTDGKYEKVWVQTAFINKRDGLTQILHDEISSLSQTSETVPASHPSDNSITENSEKDNSFDENNSKNVSDERKSVKRSYEPSSEVDSKGSELSLEQADYFKDSKVRDKDGNLLVVYHGTMENFSVFDITKSRSYDEKLNYDLPGFYFSESNEESGGYGSAVKPYYVNVTNPYDGDTYKLAKEKGSYRKAYDYLVSQGYDGIIDTEMGEGFTEIIAFHPEQIKLTTNKKPTKNPDIRYSKQRSYEPGGESEKYSYDTLVGKDDLIVKKLSEMSQEEYENYQKDKTKFASVCVKKVRAHDHPLNTETRTYAHCADLDADIMVSKDSFKHGLARVSKEYYQVCLNFYEILENSVALNELNARDNTNGGIVLLGMCETEDLYVYVRTVVNNKTYNTEDYDIVKAIKKSQQKKEDADHLAPGLHLNDGSQTSSTISITNLLDNVKNIDLINEIFSKDVAEKLGVERNKGDLSKDLRYSKQRSYNPFEDIDDEGNKFVEGEDGGTRILFSMPDFDNPAYEYGHIPDEEPDILETYKAIVSSSTEADLRKRLADATKMKVYARKEAKSAFDEIITERGYFEGLNVKFKGKSRTEIEKMLWNALNSADEGAIVILTKLKECSKIDSNNLGG